MCAIRCDGEQHDMREPKASGSRARAGFLAFTRCTEWAPECHHDDLTLTATDCRNPCSQLLLARRTMMAQQQQRPKTRGGEGRGVSMIARLVTEKTGPALGLLMNQVVVDRNPSFSFLVCRPIPRRPSGAAASDACFWLAFLTDTHTHYTLSPCRRCSNSLVRREGGWMGCQSVVTTGQF